MNETYVQLNQTPAYRSCIVENKRETPITATQILVPPMTRENNLRPDVAPVHGICGHIARSPYHTCGAWACEGGY